MWWCMVLHLHYCSDLFFGFKIKIFLIFCGIQLNINLCRPYLVSFLPWFLHNKYEHLKKILFWVLNYFVIIGHSKMLVPGSGKAYIYCRHAYLLAHKVFWRMEMLWRWRGKWFEGRGRSGTVIGLSSRGGLPADEGSAVPIVCHRSRSQGVPSLRESDTFSRPTQDFVLG